MPSFDRFFHIFARLSGPPLVAASTYTPSGESAGSSRVSAASSSAARSALRAVSATSCRVPFSAMRVVSIMRMVSMRVISALRATSALRAASALSAASSLGAVSAARPGTAGSAAISPAARSAFGRRDRSIFAARGSTSGSAAGSSSRSVVVGSIAVSVIAVSVVAIIAAIAAIVAATVAARAVAQSHTLDMIGLNLYEFIIYNEVYTIVAIIRDDPFDLLRTSAVNLHFFVFQGTKNAIEIVRTNNGLASSPHRSFGFPFRAQVLTKALHMSVFDINRAVLGQNDKVIRSVTYQSTFNRIRTTAINTDVASY